jgi:sugar phosphate isomerase/epimerase
MTVQLGVFNLCEPEFAQFLKISAAAGFRQVALYVSPGRLPWELETLTAAQAAAVKEQLARHRLQAVAAGGGSNVLTQEGLDLLLRKLDGAARLGVSVFDTGSLATKGKDAAQIEKETTLFCAGMAKAGDAAAACGITICLETHGGLTGTVPSSLALMQRLRHAHVRIGYDPANVRYYEGASPLDQLHALVPFIGHVHAKDQVGGKDAAVFPTVGKGEVPYAEIVRTLLECGYRGCISVERAAGNSVEERARELRDAFAFLSTLSGSAG